MNGAVLQTQPRGSWGRWMWPCDLSFCRHWLRGRRVGGGEGGHRPLAAALAMTSFPGAR